jgi:hypothetical protein
MLTNMSKQVNFVALLALVACFVPLLLLANYTSLFRPTASVSYSTPPPVIAGVAPDLGGLGGYQAPSTAFATPCVGTPQTPVAMFKQDFGITDYQAILNKKYWNTQDKLLCNDHWPWQTQAVLPWSTIIKQLQWPTDLIQTQMENQVETVRPISIVDPTTEKQQEQTAAQQVANSAKPKNACDFVIPVLGWNIHLDVCSLLKTIVNSAFIKPIKNAAQSIIQQANGFLWSTPPADTYDLAKNPTMAFFNAVSLNLINILIVGVIAWLGLRYVLGGGFNWLSYASIQETLPRILFGLIAAYFSMQIAKVIIDGSNAFSGLFHGGMLQSMFNTQPDGTVAAVVQVIYVLMGVLLVVEDGARFAILYILLAFLPLLLFTMSLKETSHYAKGGIKALILFTFLQPAQIALMYLGQAVLTQVMTKDPGNILNYLIGIGIMFVTLSLFFSVSRVAFGGAFQPMGALATGAVAGFALGSAKFSGNNLLRGRRALNSAADKAIVGMPHIARQTPAAIVHAPENVRRAVNRGQQRVQSGVNSVVDHARTAGSKIASLTPGYATRHSKPVYDPLYTGKAASTIADPKKAALPSAPTSAIPGRNIQTNTQTRPLGSQSDLTEADHARIRAYNAQYNLRWKSVPPNTGNSKQNPTNPPNRGGKKA